MEKIHTVKRYYLSKDGSGWNFTVESEGIVWGSIHYKGTVYGFDKHEPPELFIELKSLLLKIPNSDNKGIERILVIGFKNENGPSVSLDNCENYDHNSSESSLWRCLEALAIRIVKHLRDQGIIRDN